MPNFMKIRVVDGRTDGHDDANSRSSNFAEAPENGGYMKPNNAIGKNQMQQVYGGYLARHCCAELAASP